MNSVDQHWAWKGHERLGDQEIGEALEGGRTIQAVIAGVAEAEIRLDLRRNALRVWLSPESGDGLDHEEVLREGARAAIYALIGLGRDLLVELRQPRVYMLGLQAAYHHGDLNFRLTRLGRTEIVPVG